MEVKITNKWPKIAKSNNWTGNSGLPNMQQKNRSKESPFTFVWCKGITRKHPFDSGELFRMKNRLPLYICQCCYYKVNLKVSGGFFTKNNLIKTPSGSVLRVKREKICQTVHKQVCQKLDVISRSREKDLWRCTTNWPQWPAVANPTWPLVVLLVLINWPKGKWALGTRLLVFVNNIVVFIYRYCILFSQSADNVIGSVACMNFIKLTFFNIVLFTTVDEVRNLKEKSKRGCYTDTYSMVIFTYEITSPKNETKGTLLQELNYTSKFVDQHSW